MSASGAPNPPGPFPTFGSLAEAEAYSDKVGDAYYEICYHLEGDLNLCIRAMHVLYTNAPANKRPKMQAGLVRETICPEGWPKHPQTLFATLIACARFRFEDTCHAYTIREAMTGFIREKEYEGTLQNAAFDRRTLEPWSAEDAADARKDLMRLCDWIESRLHCREHCAWYGCPDCFSDDPETVHLANIGVAQRRLAEFSERDWKRWEEIHHRAALKHGGNLKKWGIVGKVQHNPAPRTWTHPEVDTLLIGLWPLVARYNWTYTDLLNVLDKLLPAPAQNAERAYPLDSEASLKMHCRTVCGLAKSRKGKTAAKLPNGWQIAENLFPRKGK